MAELLDGVGVAEGIPVLWPCWSMEANEAVWELIVKRRLGKRAKKELALVDGLARAIDRPELATILEGASVADPRIEKMFNMMFDPAHSNKKLATMARECGLSYTELTDVIKKHRLAEGIVRMSEHVPQILTDVAEDAKNKSEFCPKCQGIGTVVDPRPPAIKKGEDVADFMDKNDPRIDESAPIPMTCPQCKGLGEVVKQGDQGARKLVFDSLGLTGGRGPLIAVQNNTLQAGDGDDLESILAMGKKKALPPQPTITVEQLKED